MDPVSGQQQQQKPGADPCRSLTPNDADVAAAATASAAAATAPLLGDLGRPRYAGQGGGSPAGSINLEVLGGIPAAPAVPLLRPAAAARRLHPCCWGRTRGESAWAFTEVRVASRILSAACAPPAVIASAPRRKLVLKGNTISWQKPPPIFGGTSVFIVACDLYGKKRAAPLSFMWRIPQDKDPSLAPVCVQSLPPFALLRVRDSVQQQAHQTTAPSTRPSPRVTTTNRAAGVIPHSQPSKPPPRRLKPDDSWFVD